MKNGREEIWVSLCAGAMQTIWCSWDWQANDHELLGRAKVRWVQAVGVWDVFASCMPTSWVRWSQPTGAWACKRAAGVELGVADCKRMVDMKGEESTGGLVLLGVLSHEGHALQCMGEARGRTGQEHGAGLVLRRPAELG